MADLIILVLSIAVVVVVVSVTFGAWLQLSPALKLFSGQVYAEVQQRVLGGLKRFMPFVVLAALIFTVLDVILSEDEGGRPFDFTVAALLLFLAFLFVTVRYELPINQEVDKWSTEQPPNDWAAKRRRWEHWQTVRAFLSVATLACLIGAGFGSAGVCS